MVDVVDVVIAVSRAHSAVPNCSGVQDSGHGPHCRFQETAQRPQRSLAKGSHKFSRKSPGKESKKHADTRLPA